MKITADPPRPETPDLSVLIPAYNEENRLPATLTRVLPYLQEQSWSWEVVIIDDGSRDQTRAVAREFSGVRLVGYDDENGHAINWGKGFAVRVGVQNAVGRDILFSDADLSTPIEELEKMWPRVQSGACDIAIASRALPESNLPVHQPPHREMMGRFFNKFVQFVAVPGIRDTQCGFKLFRGDAARRLFGLARIDGFAFDPEILFLARKFGLKIEEIPVTWRHKDDSRVSALTAPLGMLRELLTIRANDARGLYKEKSAV